MASTARDEVHFDRPSADHFLYLGWSVDPPTRLPLVRHSDRRERLITRLREQARVTARHDDVRSATVYQTELIPPLPGIPRYDVLALVRTHDPDVTAVVGEDWRALEPALMMPARNLRRIGETGATHAATFLFNHFTAAATESALAGFDRVAGWFPDHLGVDNTTLLQPVEPQSAPFAFVNHVRVPRGARTFLLSMLTRPSFHTHVRRILREHQMDALPLLARPV